MKLDPYEKDKTIGTKTVGILSNIFGFVKILIF